MMADGLTKALVQGPFESFRDLMGLVNVREQLVERRGRKRVPLGGWNGQSPPRGLNRGVLKDMALRAGVWSRENSTAGVQGRKALRAVNSGVSVAWHSCYFGVWEML
jgi:hypothetical protein